jgi:hypothetical protein
MLAAFEPNNLVPGIGASPDKMLLARISAYADAHRARIGVNYKQLPVNAPQVPVHNYSKDGAMRYIKVSPTHCMRRTPRAAHADAARYGEPAGCGRATGTWCAAPTRRTRCTPTTEASRAPWPARFATTPRVSGC